MCFYFWLSLSVLPGCKIVVLNPHMQIQMQDFPIDLRRMMRTTQTEGKRLCCDIKRHKKSELFICQSHLNVAANRFVPHSHTLLAGVFSLTSWCVSPLGCEWRGEGSLTLIDGIYNCSSNSVVACCVCALVCVCARADICVCFLLSPPTSGQALVQNMCVLQRYKQSCSRFSRTLLCVYVCLSAGMRALQMIHNMLYFSLLLTSMYSKLCCVELHCMKKVFVVTCVTVYSALFQIQNIDWE